MNTRTCMLLASASAFMLLLSAASAQADGHVSNRGILGDILDAAGLHGLLEKLYYFRNTVANMKGLDSEVLSWFIPLYANLSRILLSQSAWTFFKFIFLPGAITVSICSSFYPQMGLLGVVLMISFLAGLTYVFPIFLLIEFLSKIGLVAMHGRKMLIALLLLTVFSILITLFAYAYRNTALIFYSFVTLFLTVCFSWFLPIILYYWH